MSTAFRKNIVVRWLLLPFSWLYAGVISVRNVLYDSGILKQYRSPVSVISVGNILAGGTGKSPFTMYLIEKLSTYSIKLAVVSRGYGRRTKGPLVVSDGTGNVTDPRDGGDEPVMIARRFPNIPVIVAEQRKSGIQIAVNDFAVDLILLDDAFQHRSVHRDIDILLLDVQRNPVKEALLPAGDRREPLHAIHRTDVIIYTKQKAPIDTDPFHFRDRYPCSAFASGYIPDTFMDLSTKEEISLSEISGKKAVAFCAIAQPEHFVDTLNNLNITLACTKPYPDHYDFELKEIEHIKALAERNGCQYIITTEKDAVKIPADFKQGIPVVALRMRIAVSDEHNLLQKVQRHIDLAVKPD